MIDGCIDMSGLLEGSCQEVVLVHYGKTFLNKIDFIWFYDILCELWCDIRWQSEHLPYMVVRRCLKGNLPPKWPDNFGKFEVFFLEVSDPKLRTHGLGNVKWSGLLYVFCVRALLQKTGGKQASGWIDCEFVLGKRGNTSQDLTLLNQCFTVIPNISFVKSAPVWQEKPSPWFLSHDHWFSTKQFNLFSIT